MSPFRAMLALLPFRVAPAKIVGVPMSLDTPAACSAGVGPDSKASIVRCNEIGNRALLLTSTRRPPLTMNTGTGPAGTALLSGATVGEGVRRPQGTDEGGRSCG